MSPLPESVKDIDLLRWVVAHPNEAFDPAMVVSVTHATDWQWQAVVHQMEDLGRRTYLRKIKQDPSGVTFWTITPRGENYLRARERAKPENQKAPLEASLQTQDGPSPPPPASSASPKEVVRPSITKEFGE